MPTIHDGARTTEATGADLDHLKDRANFYHRRGDARRVKGLWDYYRAGKVLRRLRAEVRRRGQKWGEWRKAHLEFGARRDQRYRALAGNDVTSDSELRDAWRRICGNEGRRQEPTPSGDLPPESTAGPPCPAPDPPDDTTTDSEKTDNKNKGWNKARDPARSGKTIDALALDLLPKEVVPEYRQMLNELRELCGRSPSGPRRVEQVGAVGFAVWVAHRRLSKEAARG
jgi:hypothetical protein